MPKIRNITRRQFLVLALALLASVGGLAMLGATLRSLEPNAKQEAAMPHIDISSVPKDGYAILHVPEMGEFTNGYDWGLLVLTQADKSLSVWNIPVQPDGTVGMPDVNWWNARFPCKHFGPTLTNGQIDYEKTIRCHDEQNASKWQDRHWQWDITGKNKIGFVEDLYLARGIVDGRYFVYGKTP